MDTKSKKTCTRWVIFIKTGSKYENCIKHKADNVKINDRDITLLIKVSQGHNHQTDTNKLSMGHGCTLCMQPSKHVQMLLVMSMGNPDLYPLKPVTLHTGMGI